MSHQDSDKETCSDPLSGKPHEHDTIAVPDAVSSSPMAIAAENSTQQIPETAGSLGLYKGGEELRRAVAALAGPNAEHREGEKTAASNDGASSSASHAAQLIPISVKSADHSTRELAFAAQRYAKAAQKNPSDFESVYNHGLALQELASRMASSRTEQMRLLEQACDRYSAAWKIKQSSHSALYNWGVALSDMSRVLKATDRAAANALLTDAAEKYATSLQWNANNPQALNNWGLVLQELSTMVPDHERAQLVVQSVQKFRRAIRLRPEFDRACYNLGTVYYSHAHTLSSSAAAQLSSQLTQDRQRERQERADDEEIESAFRLAALYITLAFALQPKRDVYKRSLKVVRPLLPGGALCAGPLQAVVPSTAHSSSERWETRHFVLDHNGFRDTTDGQTSPGSSSDTCRVALNDIGDVKPCMDPSLPGGHAFWVSLHSLPTGLYFTADSTEAAEGWVDAFLMVAHIATAHQLPALAHALTVEFPP